jgi:hypothetical protein
VSTFVADIVGFSCDVILLVRAASRPILPFTHNACERGRTFVTDGGSAFYGVTDHDRQPILTLHRLALLRAFCRVAIFALSAYTQVALCEQLRFNSSRMSAELVP